MSSKIAWWIVGKMTGTHRGYYSNCNKARTTIISSDINHPRLRNVHCLNQMSKTN